MDRWRDGGMTTMGDYDEGVRMDEEEEGMREMIR